MYELMHLSMNALPAKKPALFGKMECCHNVDRYELIYDHLDILSVLIYEIFVLPVLFPDSYSFNYTTM
jgi:hypothetical protein